MSDTTSRLSLPLLQPGQAQKESTHNEALAILDIAVQASVLAVGATVPPANPDVGAAWILGAAPTGDWAGHAFALAAWTAGGWRFVVPREGMMVWHGGDRHIVRFSTGTWVSGVMSGANVTIGGQIVVGARRPAIANPPALLAGATPADSDARSAIVAILDALRGHGMISA